MDGCHWWRLVHHTLPITELRVTNCIKYCSVFQTRIVYLLPFRFGHRR